MIHIKFNQIENFVKIEIIGHANYSEKGKDIVCASISVLYQNLINSIVLLTDSDVDEISRSGNAIAYITNLNDYTIVLIDSFRLGCIEIEKAYPEYVEVQDVQAHLE